MVLHAMKLGALISDMNAEGATPYCLIAATAKTADKRE